MPNFPTTLIAVCASMLMLARPAAAEVIKQTEDSFVTRNAVVVKASPFEAWQALITPARWWNDNHTWSADAENLYISAQAGGCFCELLPLPKDAPEGVRRGSAQHMTVVLADPPKALRMRGGLGPLQSEPVDGVLTITLTGTEKGTVIVFEYVVGGYMRFETAEIAKAVDGVMGQQLAGLAKLLGPVAAVPAKGRPEAQDPVKPETKASETKAPETNATVKDQPKAANPSPAKKSKSVEDAFSQRGGEETGSRF